MIDRGQNILKSLVTIEKLSEEDVESENTAEEYEEITFELQNEPEKNDCEELSISPVESFQSLEEEHIIEEYEEVISDRSENDIGDLIEYDESVISMIQVEETDEMFMPQNDEPEIDPEFEQVSENFVSVMEPSTESEVSQIETDTSDFKEPLETPKPDEQISEVPKTDVLIKDDENELFDEIDRVVECFEETKKSPLIILDDVVLSQSSDHPKYQRKKRFQFICDICTLVFVKEEELYEHMETHTNAKYECLECHSIFQQKDIFRKHQDQTNHIGVGFVGEPDEFNLEKHKIRVAVGDYGVVLGSTILDKDMKPESRVVFNCPKCPKTFKDRVYLNRHLNRHDKEKPFECKKCVAAFKFSENLVKHMKEKHIKGRMFDCSRCSSTFKTMESLSNHMNLHTSSSSYHCDVCGKVFGQKYNLDIHIRTHTNERPYNCDSCDSKFKTTQQLQVHRKTHAEPNIKCTDCEFMFTNENSMQVHRLRIHLKKKTFDCDFCDKNFTNFSTLGTHMRTHTGEKPYKCSVCHKLFADRSNFRKHQYTHLKRSMRDHNTSKKRLEAIEKDKNDGEFGAPLTETEAESMLNLEISFDQDEAEATTVNSPPQPQSTNFSDDIKQKIKDTMEKKLIRRRISILEEEFEEDKIAHLKLVNKTVEDISARKGEVTIRKLPSSKANESSVLDFEKEIDFYKREQNDNDVSEVSKPKFNLMDLFNSPNPETAHNSFNFEEKSKNVAIDANTNPPVQKQVLLVLIPPKDDSEQPKMGFVNVIPTTLPTKMATSKDQPVEIEGEISIGTDGREVEKGPLVNDDMAYIFNSEEDHLQMDKDIMDIFNNDPCSTTRKPHFSLDKDMESLLDIPIECKKLKKRKEMIFLDEVLPMKTKQKRIIMEDISEERTKLSTESSESSTITSKVERRGRPRTKPIVPKIRKSDKIRAKVASFLPPSTKFFAKVEKTKKISPDMVPEQSDAFKVLPSMCSMRPTHNYLTPSIETELAVSSILESSSFNLDADNICLDLMTEQDGHLL